MEEQYDRRKQQVEQQEARLFDGDRANAASGGSGGGDAEGAARDVAIPPDAIALMMPRRASDVLKTLPRRLLGLQQRLVSTDEVTVV